MASDPRRSGGVPPVHDGRRAVTFPVGGPPAVGVVAPDVTTRSPYRRKVRLEVGGIAIWELGRFPVHDSSTSAAPRRSGKPDPAGLAGAGAGVLTASGFQSTGLQVPAGDFGWQTSSRVFGT